MFDEPPEPPEPEDDPEGYAQYLRRNVIAMARRYFVEHGHEELEAKDSYAGLPCIPGVPDLRKATLEDIIATYAGLPCIPGVPDLRKATLEDIIATIKYLDDWKREFKLEDID